MKKMIITMLVCLGLVMSMTSVSFADDATKKESVKKLLSLLKVDTQMSEMNKKMKDAAEQQLKAQNLPDTLYWKIEKILDKQFDLVNNEINWDKISGDIIQVYMDVFEEKEIEELNQFYSTDVGQKLVAKLPELYSRGMQITQKKVMEKQAEIQQTMFAEWQKFDESLTEEERKLLQERTPAGYGL